MERGAMTRKTREQKRAENMADVMENGPGLRYSMNTWIIAKSHDGRFAYRGGLGAMGCGEMWCVATDEDRADPEWAEAPVHHYVPDPDDRGAVFRLGPEEQAE